MEFEALHPFQDGNGRIGRMLITLYLWQAQVITEPHFYISGYLDENKDLYIDTMRQVSESDNWNIWCQFFFNAVEQQAIKNLAVSQSIQNLYNEMKVKFASILSSKWSVQALDFVFTNPVFKNSKFTGTSGIPIPTAAKFTKKLLDNGFIVERRGSSGRRAALYSFEPLMELVRI